MIASNIVAPYTALEWGQKAWRDKSLIKLYTGSAGGGKSREAAEELHAKCLKYAGTTALMLRKTRESANNSIVLFMRHTIQGGDTTIRHTPSYSRFEYPNGSMLHYGGMKDDAQREQIRSIGQTGSVDFIWMEEAVQFSENDFNELLGRLRGDVAGWRQIILTTNPGAPAHWIYQRLIKGGEGAVYYSSALDNPHNPPEYIKILNMMTGVLRQRLVEGKWVQAEGVVYNEFDPELHLFHELPKDPYFFKRYIAGVDWGYTNPGVIKVYGLDGDGRLYMVHEVYECEKQVGEWWVPKAKQLAGKYPIDAFICDPAEPAFIKLFRDAGLTAIEANNEVREGIDRMKARLKPAGDGKPRLTYYAHALENIDSMLEYTKRPIGTIDEITAYVWATSSAGKSLKEEPVKEHDHAMDVDRYIVNYLDAPAGIFLARL